MDDNTYHDWAAHNAKSPLELFAEMYGNYSSDVTVPAVKEVIMVDGQWVIVYEETEELNMA